MKYLEILNLHKLALAGALILGLGAAATAQQAARAKRVTDGLTPRVEKPMPKPAPTPAKGIPEVRQGELVRHKTAKDLPANQEALKRIVDKKATKL